MEHIHKINCEVARKQDYLVVLRMCVANSYKLCNKKDFEITWKLINNTYTEFKKGRPNKWKTLRYRRLPWRSKRKFNSRTCLQNRQIFRLVLW